MSGLRLPTLQHHLHSISIQLRLAPAGVSALRTADRHARTGDWAMRHPPAIVIDTREQTPFTFANLPMVTGTLDTGDYSIVGLTHLVAVERKSLPDLLACVGRERDRFVRALQRLSAYPYRLLVIEATAAQIEAGDWRGKIVPAHVMGALASWSAKWCLPVWLGGTHDACGRYVERWLFQAARHVAETYGAASQAVESWAGAEAVEAA